MRGNIIPAASEHVVSLWQDVGIPSLRSDYRYDQQRLVGGVPK